MEKSKRNKGKIFDILSYKGMSVITLNMIDERHERVKWTARAAFYWHKDKFYENIDCFLLLPKEALKLYEIKARRGLYVFTKNGYLKIVKPFGDDLSWNEHDILINKYFKLKRYTRKELDHLVNKRIKRQLSDAIQESGLNEKMNGFAYKNFTDLIYTLVLGMTAQEYIELMNIEGELRDNLSFLQLKLINKLKKFNQIIYRFWF